jgi:hypothetical protein
MHTGAVSYDYGLLPGDPVGKHAVRCTQERTLFHSIKYLCNMMLSMMKEAREIEPRIKSKSRNFDFSFAFFGGNGDSVCTGSDCCDDPQPSPIHFSMQTEETGAPKEHDL